MTAKLNFTIYHNIINNELSAAPSTRHSINPATQKPNPEVPVATQDDLDRAVKAARDAFENWSKTSFAERQAALNAYANAIEVMADDFAKTLTMEQGKPLAQAATEVGMASTWIRAISAFEIPRNIIEETENRTIVQRYTPIGVAAAIVPWNFPVLLAIGKITQAVYAGNSVIVKPSPFTPYCDLKLVELATRFFPPGVVQCLSGDDSLGPMITEHPGIDKVSFTGSILTGRKVMASCAKTLKRVTLELGGNDPAIICDDVDIDAVIPKKLVDFVKTLKVGEGTEADVFVGPVQNKMQFEKAKDLFQTITTDKLKAALGGAIQDSTGYFIHPTIIDNPPENCRVVQEEPFAPILPVLKWSDEEDVIERANALETGLGSSVWSKDLDRAQRIADQLQSGSVWVNSHFQVAPNAPFGGHKQSGMGVEWGLTGLLAYCNSQTQWLNKSY
ncbi:Aldehyde dehydrogenase N-terminal [Penicillium angulare]|uniref:Aldehyde dehydrogenase N-terminal n=1 Tax=Penicillium angulare TaxID=116970 RepID=UPI0025425642|nr:Aldehyde dehydrogenase N-terminal [Penicillium angulare]KAJ5281974.1 Aldehyde dehydrogenase N-terminal [Penicillium angulare]